MSKSKFFRVAVEGATVDGRTIERNWLTEIAASYNRDTYAARVNMEHIRGITADKPFKAYGDVLAVKVEDVEIELDGKKQTKLALFAEIDATDELVAMNRGKQKLYTSIEVNPNFAGTGKAYLMGLAVTDSPASLGTEMLTFAVKHPGIMRHGPQLQSDGNIFSLGHETRIELADGTQGDDPFQSSEARSFFAAGIAAFKGLLAGQQQHASEPAGELKNDPPANGGGNGGGQQPANDNDARFAAIATGMEAMTKGVEAMGNSFAKALTDVRGDVTRLAASIENTDANPQKRQPATGAATQFVTDC